MEILTAYVNAITERYEEHGERLRKVQVKTDEILTTLDSAAYSAASLQASMSTTFAFRGWWPYIYSPVISLVFGSYGLSPSLTRNIALLGIGEVVGFIISTIMAISRNIDHATGGTGGYGTTNMTSLGQLR